MLIDIHVHCRRVPGFQGRGERSYQLPDQLIAQLDTAGIDRAVVLGRMSPECGHCYVPPEDTLAMAQQHPGRLIPFMNLDPRMLANSPSADFRPMLEHYKQAGCKGVGEYVANLPFDDPMQMNVFRQVEELGLPLTFHISPTIGECYGCYDELGLPRLEKVLRACPDLKLLGHSQPFWGEISADLTEDGRNAYPKGPVTPGRVVELMRAYPNLYGDLSAGSGHNAMTRDPEFGYAFMDEFQDRLLFGTDLVYPDQDVPIVAWFGRLRDEKLISDDAHDKIAWRNASELLGLGLG